MKFKFDPNQEFQLQAINSVIDCFEGQEKTTAQTVAGLGLFGIYPNILTLSEKEILKNIKTIQKSQNLTLSDGDKLLTEDGQSFKLETPVKDISVEMETGTGKTYVYLRTIFELNQKYGWKKFIILVPSVAIREGVIKTLKITEDHFRELYANTPFRFYEYKSKSISQVRHFADSSVINIMVMTVGAFNKDANVLYGARDQMQGEQPIEFIKKTNPILILDEPQNMEGEATKKALENFNALFRLRYSATHKNLYNLVHQLTPYDAYQLGLVKKIEVFSVTDDDSGNSTPHMVFVEAKPAKTASGIKAKAELAFADNDGNRKIKAINLKKGDDLVNITNNKAYNGYVVSNIDADAPEFGAEGKVHFTNGFVLSRETAINQNKEDIWRRQISETIRLHIEKKQKYKDFEIKVLSLFFIDKVANYAGADGLIRKIFTEELSKVKDVFTLGQDSINSLHTGYFAKKKDGSFVEQESAIEKNDEAYELIMKDKERLLSFYEPVEFIFSHSALREGWDNPNVFNICTLNETTSTMKKRQEIGRGMRLCVNQNGDRIFDRHINLLSVVANISYADYVASLQAEFQEDGIYKTPQVPYNAKQRSKIVLKPGFQKDENFKELWNRISKKTRYLVKVNTESLITNSARVISEIRLQKPHIRVDRAGINISAEGVKSLALGSESGEIVATQSRTIDCVSEIKAQTRLTRATIADIVLKANNWEAFFSNPDRFIVEASKIIKQELVKTYVEQVSYEIISDSYKVEEFKALESYEDSTLPVTRSIYDAIVHDSDVEMNFALDLEHDEQIKLFIKMPNWYKVETPVGGYNPDWAIVTAKRDLKGNEGEKVYFVIETKGDIENLRPTEKAKIESAKKHFEVIKVNYKEIDNYQAFSDLIG
ncbi:DEAD/DEAH box helicase [Candidatus Falkowbacteria bacterium CG10_big_fil_rev_8_21_14_0_10_39_9]|uniref:DEAD/DEAH box helicase n=1 Tax=Candidatus Falkowbacteria bacterium CG10_big_fil_rev_8_21_14_0_10_39_9 TaxID=1974566 RepID=A0A2M6WR18_9BACT|nr:MAG: DEAD/DEAH box helicase [Candidatus Falkowbacteria bacterium CG10_big_fil_rev_8_21_14_0_10_39_9]